MTDHASGTRAATAAPNSSTTSRHFGTTSNRPEVRISSKGRVAFIALVGAALAVTSAACTGSSTSGPTKFPPTQTPTSSPPAVSTNAPPLQDPAAVTQPPIPTDARPLLQLSGQGPRTLQLTRVTPGHTIYARIVCSGSTGFELDTSAGKLFYKGGCDPDAIYGASRKITAADHALDLKVASSVRWRLAILQR